MRPQTPYSIDLGDRDPVVSFRETPARIGVIAGAWSPADFERFLKMEPRLQGYVGGSSAERFPIETSVVQATRDFKYVKLLKAN